MDAGISRGKNSLPRHACIQFEHVEVSQSWRSLIVFSFSPRLRFRLNLADMFSFFLPSQHPLSAYCWARQEPCESWSELLNAGVYRSNISAKADSLFCSDGNVRVEMSWGVQTVCESEWWCASAAAGASDWHLEQDGDIIPEKKGNIEAVITNWSHTRGAPNGGLVRPGVSAQISICHPNRTLNLLKSVLLRAACSRASY